MSVSAAPPAASSPVYGSSSSTTLGSWTIARAIDTRCCMPRLNARTGVSARSAMRMRSSARMAAACGSGTPYSRAANSTFSRAVSAPYSML